MGDRETDTVHSHGARRSPEEEEFARQLGAAMRHHRLAREMTQEDLARRANLSRASIANIERGTQTPQVYRLSLVARALSCSIEDLIPQSIPVTNLKLEAASKNAVESVLRVTRSRRLRA